MTHTGLIYRKAFDANLADRFDQNEVFHAQIHRFPARAAGSMATSLIDLARFTTALLNSKIINAKTMQQMFSPVLAIRTEHEIAIASVETNSTESANVGPDYGVGWESSDSHQIWTCLLQREPRRRCAKLHDLLSAQSLLHDSARR